MRTYSFQWHWQPVGMKRSVAELNHDHDGYHDEFEYSDHIARQDAITDLDTKDHSTFMIWERNVPLCDLVDWHKNVIEPLRMATFHHEHDYQQMWRSNDNKLEFPAPDGSTWFLSKVPILQYTPIILCCFLTLPSILLYSEEVRFDHVHRKRSVRTQVSVFLCGIPILLIWIQRWILLCVFVELQRTWQVRDHVPEWPHWNCRDL